MASSRHKDTRLPFQKPGISFLQVPSRSIDEGHDNILLVVSKLFSKKIKSADKLCIRLVADPGAEEVL